MCSARRKGLSPKDSKYSALGSLTLWNVDRAA